MQNPESWEKYSMMVLSQLESLDTGIQNLQKEIQSIRVELTEIKAREDKVLEIASWKKRIDEVASPTQLEAAIKDVNELKQFKTKAITIFAVVQAAMGFAMWLMDYLK